MTGNTKKILLALFAAVAAILLNALLFWYVNCTGEYLQTSDIYGRQYSEKRSETRRVSELLNSRDIDIPSLESRIEYFSAVIDAANTMDRSYTKGHEEAQALTEEFSRQYGVSGYKEMAERAKAESRPVVWRAVVENCGGSL